MTGHDDDISDLYVGKKIKKGERYYREGSSGMATGNHIHLEAARGKTTAAGWVENEYGRWHIENHVPPDSVFYLPETTTVINQMDLSFEYQ